VLKKGPVLVELSSNDSYFVSMVGSQRWDRQPNRHNGPLFWQRRWGAVGSPYKSLLIGSVRKMKKTTVASGRIVIDDFHERLFLFVVASTQLRLDGKMVLVGSLPPTDPMFIARLREGLKLDGPRTFPLRFDRAPLSEYRIIRLLDGSVILPEDFPHALEHPGDSSRGVTIAGHVATEEEMSGHSDVTNPTIVLESIVTFEAIQQRAFDIFRSGASGSPVDHWLRAERELLGAD
jgi:hypothetical protein